MKDGGSIIVNGSGAWQKGIPMYSTDSATKAALRSFVRTWPAELAGKGIRANMVSPGPIETPLLEAQFGPNVGAMKDRFIAMTPCSGLDGPKRLPRPFCSWRPTKAASSRASICQSMAAP